MREPVAPVKSASRKKSKKARAKSIASRAMADKSTADINKTRTASAKRNKPSTSPSAEWNRSRARKAAERAEAMRISEKQDRAAARRNKEKKRKKKVVTSPPKPRGGTKTKGPKKSTKSKKGGGKKSSRRKSGKKKFTKKKKRKAKVTRATPPAPKKKDTTKLVKTRKDGIPVLQTAFNDNTIEQQQDILNAFLAFSGTELFQYTNEQSIDGMFSDVSIISVLSSRRKDYKPNDIIALNPPFISDMWRGTGSPEEIDKLYIDVDGTRNGGQLTLNFYVGTNSVLNIIGSVDYV